MADPLTESLVGCAAAMCAELGDIGGSDRAVYQREMRHRSQRQRKPQRDVATPAKVSGQSDHRCALPSRMCLRCGLRGSHLTAADCIDALRDRLSYFE
jgi:hypothetical protein